MKQVKDGKIIQHALPINGFLSNGRAVSNYHCLPKETLETEGWVNAVEVKPTITKDQMLGSVKFEVVGDQVIQSYEVLEKPTIVEPAPDPLDEIRARLTALEGSAVVKEVT